MKKTVVLVFYLLAGVVLGGMLASLCGQVPFLEWLAYSGSIGISPDAPFVLDLSVLRLTFGFSMGISVAQVLTVGLALFLYTRSPWR